MAKIDDLKKDVQQEPVPGTEVTRAPRTIKDMLKDGAQIAELAAAIPGRAITPERFARMGLTAVGNEPKLLLCTPRSVMAGFMQAASLGLEVCTPLQHAWLLPFQNHKTGQYDVKFILGYRGMIELALRSPQVLDVQAHVVYEDDHFRHRHGLQEVLEHEKSLEEDAGKIRCYWVKIEYASGGHWWDVIKPSEIEKHRLRSSSPDSPAWKNDYPAMAKKTCIRIASPYLSMTPEMATALERDDTVVESFDNVIDVDGYEAAPATQPPTEEEAGPSAEYAP